MAFDPNRMLKSLTFFKRVRTKQRNTGQNGSSWAPLYLYVQDIDLL